MKKLLSLAILGALLAPTTAVFAQNESPKDSFDTSARCEAMITRSTERIAASASRHEDNVDRMNDSITKLQEFIAKAKDLDIDTSALETDLANLQAALADLAADHQAVQDNLSAMTQVDCETLTAEEYDSLITNAKSLHEALKANISIIKEIRQSLKTHTQEIFTTIQSMLESESSS